MIRRRYGYWCLSGLVLFGGVLALSGLEYGRRTEILARLPASECGPVQTLSALVDFNRTLRPYVRALRASTVLKQENRIALYDTPYGHWWMPSPHAMFGLQEQTRLVYGRPPEGSVVLDGGANVGAYTRTALAAGARLVVAIEPVPDNVESLKRNFASEIASGRVIVYPKGIWDKDDTLPMTIWDNSLLDSFVLKDRPESRVKVGEYLLPLTTIDSLVEELRLSSVDVIKLDIEGAERQAIAGAKRTIRRHHPLLLVATENRPDDFEQLPSVIRNIDGAYQTSFSRCALMPDSVVRPDLVVASVH